MSLYDTFMASDEEASDEPGTCTKLWDPDEEAWFCACGYDFA